MRPANTTLPGRLSNRIAGVRSSGVGVDTTPPLTAAGFVTPKPVPNKTMVSPGAAGVLLFGTRVVGPTTVLFACSAAAYAPFTKSAGATSCALTLTVALVKLLFETVTVTDPLVGNSIAVTRLICTGLM